ncbi:MAG: hypothetical protein CVU01_04520 [Bacteroidetes bacterium HGW-Bacteroidetes-18]|nr:MAG: hypothetical protein CVU01_04520 [Bacteroidetes bacterium HGW-Bacteroidetes-18]
MKIKNKIYVIFFLTLFFSCKSLSQIEKIEEQIFKTIIFDRLVKEHSGFFIECDKHVIPFEENDFLEQSGLIDIPKNVLFELKKNSKNAIKNENWSNSLLEELNLGSGFLKLRKCLNNEDIVSLFEKKKKRQTIFGISKPIFDDKKQHCVIYVSILAFPGSVSGSSFFLKKVYGKWVIVQEYDFWMS